MSLAVRKLIDDGVLWTASGKQRSENILLPAPRPAAVFRLPEIDQTLPCRGLPFGFLHEWMLEDGLARQHSGIWHAPLVLISSLLAATAAEQRENFLLHGRKVIVWIGRKAWPTPHLLQRTFGDRSSELQSLFINIKQKEQRIWAAVQALRCPAVFAVVADASRFSLTATRRLQLAAKKGAALGFLLRPPWESSMPSAAQSRWRASIAPSASNSMLWQLELVRLKGTFAAQPEKTSYPKKWLVEWQEDAVHASHYLRLLSEPQMRTYSPGSGAAGSMRTGTG